MIRKGTRVIIVDAARAEKDSAKVENGEKGTVLRCLKAGYVEVLIDGDKDMYGWDIHRSCVKRLDS